MSGYCTKAEPVVIADYGVGNLLSIQRAFEYCGADVIVISDPERILRANKIILPGVGAFPAAMKRMCQVNMDEAIKQAVKNGSYLMGICLGMQMLLTESHEMTLTSGLNLIPGSVIPIQGFENEDLKIRVPHIGWEKIRTHGAIKNPLLNGLRDSESVYFLHSYKALPQDASVVSADILYSGYSIPAVLWRDNLFGCQFHPEKSGPVGLKIIKNFIDF